jgi:hypothetical protein
VLSTLDDVRQQLDASEASKLAITNAFTQQIDVERRQADEQLQISRQQTAFVVDQCDTLVNIYA